VNLKKTFFVATLLLLLLPVSGFSQKTSKPSKPSKPASSSSLSSSASKPKPAPVETRRAEVKEVQPPKAEPKPTPVPKIEAKPALAPTQAPVGGKTAAVVKPLPSPAASAKPAPTVVPVSPTPLADGKSVSVAKPGGGGTPPPQGQGSQARKLTPFEEAGLRKAAKNGVDIGKIDSAKLAGASEAARAKFSNPANRPPDFRPPFHSPNKRPHFVPDLMYVNGRPYTPKHHKGYWGHWEGDNFFPVIDPEYITFYLASRPQVIEQYAPPVIVVQSPAAAQVAVANPALDNRNQPNPGVTFFFVVLAICLIGVVGLAIFLAVRRLS